MEDRRRRQRSDLLEAKLASPPIEGSFSPPINSVVPRIAPAKRMNFRDTKCDVSSICWLLPTHLQELDGRLVIPALRQGQLECHVLLRIAAFFIVYVHLHLDSRTLLA